jgi:hypothetical protein
MRGARHGALDLRFETFVKGVGAVLRPEGARIVGVFEDRSADAAAVRTSGWARV